MPSKILMQLQEFLCQPEVAALYSSIHKLHRSKLEEALRIRGLSLEGDESTLRVRLLRFEVQFYHPEIPIPWYNGQKKITKEEAVNLQMRVDALWDMTRMLSAESTDDAVTLDDAQAKQADRSKTCDNANDSNTENQVKYRLNCVKLLKVCNLQYNGTRGLPAQDFLENLDDFRKFSKISERVLLETLACVLDIDTKKWYRANNFTDWQSFEQKFIENYVSLDRKGKQPTIDRATQTEFYDEMKNRVVVRMPVSKTLQDLKDSLSDIGFKTTDSIITSKKSNNSTVVSSSSEIKAPVQSKIEATTRQKFYGHEDIGCCSITKSNIPTTTTFISQTLNPTLKNNSTLASTISRKNESKFPHSKQMINTKDVVQSSINSQSSTSSSNNAIVNKETPTIRNPANSVVVKSQAVVSQNNTPTNYTNPISSTQSISNNVVTNVNQGQITYHLPKPTVDSQNLSTLSTNAITSNAGCYLYARHHDCNATNLGQEYLTSQALNYGYGTYHYPMDYYMPNGFGHC